MKPHSFQSPAGIIDECELCGHSADHPIHELDGVAIGDAEDDPEPVDSGFDVPEDTTL